MFSKLRSIKFYTLSMKRISIVYIDNMYKEDIYIVW